MLIKEYGNDEFLNRIEGARLPMAWTYNCIPDHFFALDYIHEGCYLDLQEAGKIMKLVFKTEEEMEE